MNEATSTASTSIYVGKMTPAILHLPLIQGWPPTATGNDGHEPGGWTT